MASRTPTLQVSIDGFHTLLATTLQYSNTAQPDAITGWLLDGAGPMATGSDVLLTLYGVQITLGVFKDDDLDGQNDPRERQEDCPFGGPTISRSVRDAQGKSTFTVSGRAATYGEDLIFGWLAALPAFLAAQGFVPPGP